MIYESLFKFDNSYEQSFMSASLTEKSDITKMCVNDS
jgi:hypothetical protein